jgi:signal transduction histidine kinase
MPIVLPDGTFFGTLCAIDPKPRMLNTPETIGMFKLFAELIAFHIDAISRLAKSEANLLREREVANLRELFIAVLGHDLRSPLQSIVSGMERLRRQPEQLTSVAPLIIQTVKRMAKLIDNVLDFARGRLGGGIMLTSNPDDLLASALHQIIEEVRSNRPDRVIEVDIALTETVNCDRARIGQLFSNLLGNAITHGAPDRPIGVSAKTADGVFELSVCNGGEPIPPAAQTNLFQPFFRATEDAFRGGLGLGLYIVSEIARAHGGTIDVTSTAAETRFTFRMRIADALAASSAAD